MLIQKMLKNPNRLLATTLVGTNIAVVISSSCCTRLLYDRYGSDAGWLTTLLLSPIILIFAEFIPKAVFAHSANKITFYLGAALKFFWKILYPIVWLVNIFVNAILTVITGKKPIKKKSLFVTRDEIRYLVKESEAEGHIDKYERSIIYKIFDIGKKKIDSVMNGLDELAYLSESDTIGDLLEKAGNTNYSRFPVKALHGNFIGIINILDVVYEQDKSLPLKEFLRPIEYVDADMYVDNALFRIKSKKQTLAIAIDSKDKPIGFFTMEDLLEELVGEID
jgi:CBS domain containing-hemolysin-like protein